MRWLSVVALTACFTARTPAERPRALAYNALTIVAGVASAFAGYGLARAGASINDSCDCDSPVPIFVAVLGGGGILGGALLTLGGLGGIAATELDLQPTH